MTEDILTPATKRTWCKDFLQHKFWTKIMRQELEAKLQEARDGLIVCPLENVTELRGVIKGLAIALGIPDNILASCAFELDKEKHLNPKPEAADGAQIEG